jgi:hypothetical protein
MTQERNDYSGPFNRHFRYEDFSKEFLGKLLCEYGRLYELIRNEYPVAVQVTYHARILQFEEALNLPHKIPPQLQESSRYIVLLTECIAAVKYLETHPQSTGKVG